MLSLKYSNTDIQKALKLLENTIQILSEYQGALDQAKTTTQTNGELRTPSKMLE